MLRYCWVLPLSNEPKHIYVGLAVTEPIDFLSRTVEFCDIAHYSQAQSGVVMQFEKNTFVFFEKNCFL